MKSCESFNYVHVVAVPCTSSITSTLNIAFVSEACSNLDVQVSLVFHVDLAGLRCGLHDVKIRTKLDGESHTDKASFDLPDSRST